jgi:hypothetical protein
MVVSRLRRCRSTTPMKRHDSEYRHPAPQVEAREELWDFPQTPDRSKSHGAGRALVKSRGLPARLRMRLSIRRAQAPQRTNRAKPRCAELSPKHTDYGISAPVCYLSTGQHRFAFLPGALGQDKSFLHSEFRRANVTLHQGQRRVFRAICDSAVRVGNARERCGLGDGASHVLDGR